MAIIYYPKSSVMFQRDALSGSYEQISLNLTPNTILYFDTSSTLNAVSSSTMYLTASNAIDSETSVSSSYAATTTIADVSLISDQALSASYLEGNGKIIGGLQFDTSSATASLSEGYVFWDNDNHTLAIKPDDLASTLQVGQETWLRVIAGENIGNGQAVYLSGSMVHGLHTETVAYLALATGATMKSGVVGLATNDITSGSHGLITTNGVVNDINTVGLVEGSAVWLSPFSSGSLIPFPPIDPYEKVLIGYCIHADTDGKIYVNVTGLPHSNYPFVGITSLPTMSIDSSSSSGSVITVKTGSVNLCTATDGRGFIKNYTLNSASFIVTSSFADAQYIVADYNNGSPRYKITESKDSVNGVQTTLVYTLLNSYGNFAYSDWDNPGILLANKDYSRIQALRGVERESGCDLSTSASAISAYIQVSSGYAWQGVNRKTLPAINSSGSRTILVCHSSSAWSGSFITDVVYNKADNGTNLVNVPGGDYVVNWIYRSVLNTNATIVMLGPSYGTANNAIESQPPAPPDEASDFAFLVGRIIAHNTVAVGTRIYQVDSAYTQTFLPAGITDHNALNNLQGGTTGEYYHLTNVEYTNIQNGTASLATTASIALTSSFVYYTGATSGSEASASMVLDGFMQVKIGSSYRWIPYYNNP